MCNGASVNTYSLYLHFWSTTWTAKIPALKDVRVESPNAYAFGGMIIMIKDNDGPHVNIFLFSCLKSDFPWDLSVQIFIV